MAKKPPQTRADKRAKKTSKRLVGKSVRERITKQTRSKPGQVETPVKNVSRNRASDGATMERVRVRFASDCKPCPDCGEPFCVVCQQHYADCQCPGPSNAEDDGWKLVEEKGVLYAIRERRS